MTSQQWTSIEIDLRDWGITRDTSLWCGADCLLAEVHVGETFQDLLENAAITFVDQDGGDAGIIPFDGSYLTKAQYDTLEQELACRWAQEVDNTMPNKP